MTWLNGQQIDCLPLPHRGLAYGDGLFETIRMEQGNVPLLDRHLIRLASSANKLKFTNQSAISEITDITQMVVDSLPVPVTGVLKIILLRSHQGRGYRHETDNKFDLIHEFYPAESMDMGWNMKSLHLGCCQSRVSVNPTLAGHKHLNRLDSVMAAKECYENGWDDGLLFSDDQVIETTSANVFVIKDAVLSTPRIEKAGVRGVSRDLILEHSKNCFEQVLEANLYFSDLKAADFIFVTNAVIIARPVSRLFYGQEIKDYNSQNQLFNTLINLLSGVLKGEK